jgi:hypothetical protein
MLEKYFVKPQTVDRIRGLWIGAEIERYVVWLSEHGYSHRTVVRRVPILARFGRRVRPRPRRSYGRGPACASGRLRDGVASTVAPCSGQRGRWPTVG